MSQNDRNKKPNRTWLYLLLGGIGTLIIVLWGWIRKAVLEYKFLNGFIPQNLFLKADTVMSGIHLTLSTLNGTQKASLSPANYETIDEKQFTPQEVDANLLRQVQNMNGKQTDISAILPFLGV
ncbi:MAG: hypothetical protein CUN52_01945 [Phototrophicales bacterium]|nr:MAG: hypothetical protein CUN52_01945 [Phototrophicales bacterium]